LYARIVADVVVVAAAAAAAVERIATMKMNKKMM
jgi:hypothetical protein